MERIDRRRRAIAGIAATALTGPRWAPALAQAYPSRPIRIVHGFDSGANPDVVARIIGPALTERLGFAIVVDPRPGAGGRIATAHVATQEPDGYTLMMLTAGDSVTAATDSALSYDLLRDFACISTVIQFPFVIMASAQSPLKSLSAMLDAARANPGKLSFGTPGVRTTQHLAGELLKSMGGIDLLHVPFKGSAFQELIGGRIDLMIAAPSVSTPQIRSGKVRALAVTGRARMEGLADTPAVAESLPGYEVSSWLGLAAPAKTAPAVIGRLSADVRHVLAQEAVRARLLALGSEPDGGSGEAMRARIDTDIRKWKNLAQKARLDN